MFVLRQMNTSHIQKISIMFCKFFGGEIYSLIVLIPVETRHHFNVSVLQHFTTSHRRQNSIVCLEGRILFEMNSLIMLRMNWVISIFWMTFLRKLSGFGWSGKSLPLLSLAIEKSEFKVKYSVWIPYNKSTVLPY